MRRKQPVTPQRRPEPRDDRSAQSNAGFSAFTAKSEQQGLPGGPNGARPTPGPATETLENGDDRQGSGSRYEFLAFRNWRVPTRLIAILLIPVVIGLVFGGMRVNSSFSSYLRAAHEEKAAELARAATDLADALENERDLTMIPLTTGSDPQGQVAKYRGITDQDLQKYTAAYNAVVKDNDAELARRNYSAQVGLANLQHLRDNAYKPELYASATQAAYSAMIDPLLAFDNSVGTGSAAGVARGRAIYAISLAKASASSQRDLMLQVMVGSAIDRNTHEENSDLIQDLLVSAKLEGVSMTEFTNGSSPADAGAYANQLVAQDAIDKNAPLRMPDGATLPTMSGLMGLAMGFSDAAQIGHQNGDAQAAAELAASQQAGLVPANWLQATDSHIKPLRGTESALLDSVVQDATNTKDNAQSDAILNSAIVIGALALAGLLTGFIARSMILGMRVLNTSALQIANHRLPDLVEKLSKTDPDRVDTNVEEIALWGKDEIGEVARAFDQVHRQAVALAAEQALLRGNLNAIFSNLSRRSQSLIQRQLALITDLENNEADPDQLENLFKLDHLATRMRRNGENLLVLAGEEPGRRWNTPVPLVDVLRAAASEVEQYERIELSGIPEAEVVGAAVTDLVHLLAELLENATSFSSPQTRVSVNAARLPDGRVLVEIHDKGIGLSAEDFAEINEKLADPPTVDASISRRMGLFVVGRLSDRHNIRVQLRPSGESAGTTSLVMLPAGLTHMRAMPEPEEEFTVSRIFNDQGADQWGQDAFPAQPTAAELGFDDNLSAGDNSGGFSPALDSMQRTLRLEQRRKNVLESGPGFQEPAQQPGRTDGPGEFAPGGYPQQGGHQDRYGQQPEYVDAEFVESEPEYQGYQQQPQPPQQPYQQECYYAEPGYGQATRQDQYGQQNYYGEQQQPQPQQYAEYQQYQQGYQEPARFDGFSPRTAERAGGHPYPEQAPALPAAPQPPATPVAPVAPAAPAAPIANRQQNVLGSGLPQRRPGEQLAAGGAGPSARAIGAPNRGEQPNWFTGAKDTSGMAGDDSRSHVVSGLGASGPTGPTTAAWQGANDDSWQRAEQLREPAAGGVTGAGLPRRVPKQNLVPGNAKPASVDGPQVSRSPEEVRGRLTNLRRGVEQARIASGDPSTTGSFRIDPQDMSRPGRTGLGQPNNSTDLFGGSNHQER
ncbi:MULTISPECIES: nitrate- and nitrite sensing domain-containing protein [Kitasatospora]|uniref:nitrate- and nitrite sensing domain-containing protein n=1 Tax=Kitasatospora TaxID=2063 RepID=UPI000CC5A440|nr:nitrate- and nitrite sensing domain-containing protein [Kitasatospora sp. GP30]MDH6145363.1 signal transduction histidine kinase [Kitasatospora sp. GP30]